jgi:hypothetical protein
VTGLPPLAEEYRWQLVAEDGSDCTGDYLGQCYAVEARVWREDESVLVLQRKGDFGYWGPNGVDREGGLRKWVIEGPAPDGLMEWEQFEVLGDIPHRAGFAPCE